MKILLHTCCAPCSVYCIDKLKQMNIDMDVYWYNPNIHPYTEYKKRMDTLKQYTQMINVNAIFEDEYGLDEFCKNVISDLKNRCMNYCYRIRLEKTAKYAKEHNYDAFSTTLLISPYQNHNGIKQIAEEMVKKYDIPFLYEDFRPGFKIGQAKARELKLYIQQYCGCIFSEESRYTKTNEVRPVLPNNFKFIEVPRLEVRKIEKKEEYIDLLLESGQPKKLITNYLKETDMYGLKLGNELISLAVIYVVDKKTIELKNLVTKKIYQNKGYATKLLKALCGNYKQKYNKILVGVTENNIPFFVKQGFDNYEKTIKNFFIDNYKEEIKDGDLVCTDLIYYSKDLKKKVKDK